MHSHTVTKYIMFSMQFRRFQYIGCDSSKHHDLMEALKS